MGVYDIKNYVIGIIIFLMIIISGLTMINVFSDNDNNNYIQQEKVNEFDSLLNQSAGVIDESNKLEEKLTSNNATDFGTFGVLNSLVSTSWQGIRLITKAFAFAKNIFYAPYRLGVPLWLLNLVYAIILFILLYAIIDAVFGGAGR